MHSLLVGESAAQALASYASLQSRLLAIIRAVNSVVDPSPHAPLLITLDFQEPSLPVQLEERILRLNLRSAAALVLVQLEQDDTRDSFLRKVSTTQDQGLMDLLQLVGPYSFAHIRRCKSHCEDSFWTNQTCAWYTRSS